MFSYDLVHVLLYIYTVNFVLYGSFHLVLPPLTWYAWFFLKFDVLFFLFLFFLLFGLFFHGQAVGALEMNEESLLILCPSHYKFQWSFFSQQAPISRLFIKWSKFVRIARLSTTQIYNTERFLRRRIKVAE